MNSSRSYQRSSSRGFASAGSSIVGGGNVSQQQQFQPQIQQKQLQPQSNQAYRQQSNNDAPHPFVPGLLRNFIPFNNIEPRTREVRRGQTDKETLEKQRLKSRTGGFHKYDEKQTVTGYDEGTPGFVSEACRFDTGAASMEFERRQERLHAKHTMWETKRVQQLNRENDRWKKMDDDHKNELKQLQRYREESTFGKKNVCSVPYDAITLRYNDSHQGDELRYQDEIVRYKAALRAQQLQSNMMGQGINPLTGEDMQRAEVPMIPDRENTIQLQKAREIQERKDLLDGTDLASSMKSPYEPGYKDSTSAS